LISEIIGRLFAFWAALWFLPSLVFAPLFGFCTALVETTTMTITKETEALEHLLALRKAAAEGHYSLDGEHPADLDIDGETEALEHLLALRQQADAAEPLDDDEIDDEIEKLETLLHLRKTASEGEDRLSEGDIDEEIEKLQTLLALRKAGEEG
jgi:hypothetical protein